MDAMQAADGADGSLDALYERVLAGYFANHDETELSRAYDLGRAALSRGASIPDLAAAHARALARRLAEVDASGAASAAVSRASAFFCECVAPFEMTHRGYREAIDALRHVNDALEHEIRRIAHALHDEAGQLLTAVHLALADVAAELPRGADAQLGTVRSRLDQVERQLRRLAHELRPTILDDLGWLPAIEFLAQSVSKRLNLPIEVRSSVERRFPVNVETALYRIIQEALTNAGRHARPTSIRIDIREQDDQLCCEVADDGAGFDVAGAVVGGGLGLKGMRERLEAVNGRLQIDSRPGAGTRLRVRLPMDS